MSIIACCQRVLPRDRRFCSVIPADRFRPPTSTSSGFGRRRRRGRSLATVYLGLGSNVGDRHANILKAYKGLCELGKVDASSFLYETPPMYVKDQPWFLNAACRLNTELEPVALLERLKTLEAAIGRVHSARWGPRAVDVDILMYDDLVLENGERDRKREGGIPQAPSDLRRQQQPERWLQIPHPRMHERPFVLLPLGDIKPDLVHPLLRSTAKELLEGLGEAVLSAEEAGRAGSGGTGGAERVLPMGYSSNGETSRLWPMEGERSRTYVMGILNATPDSFSDGGTHYAPGAVAVAVERALAMARDGADIVDIGGESTRPGATEVSAEEEMSRVVPIIEGIRAATGATGTGSTGAEEEGGDNAPVGRVAVTISVDTRRAAVAEAAVAAGANVVNDVSGGTFDQEMLPVVARAGVPLVMMHMRGTPQTMTSLTDYSGNVVGEVSDSLEACSRAADIAGVPRWMHVLDPGIGFAKTHPQSLLLMRELDVIGKRVGSPLLVGPSRKRFIGELTSEPDPSRRDWGTVGACCSLAERGANIVRVHNVRGAAQALAVSDAIRGREARSMSTHACCRRDGDESIMVSSSSS
ncbi:unnamed protein product [Pylaiella littoralis]